MTGTRREKQIPGGLLLQSLFITRFYHVSRVRVLPYSTVCDVKEYVGKRVRLGLEKLVAFRNRTKNHKKGAASRGKEEVPYFQVQRAYTVPARERLTFDGALARARQYSPLHTQLTRHRFFIRHKTLIARMTHDTIRNDDI